MEKSRVYVCVSGNVQGVNFRYETRKKARDLGIGGWIRNTEKGEVEMEIEGEKQDLEKIIGWIKKEPGFFKIESVEVFWKEFKDEFKVFEIKY